MENHVYSEDLQKEGERLKIGIVDHFGATELVVVKCSPPSTSPPSLVIFVTSQEAKEQAEAVFAGLSEKPRFAYTISVDPMLHVTRPTSNA